MRKECLNNNWRRLDNIAKVFSLHSKNNTNIFRYSVILKHNVNKIILKRALKITLNQFKAFKVKFAVSFCWNYLQLNTKELIVEEEDGRFCERIDLKKNNDYLFKVTYYKNKINLDVFHVLTDGTGAIKFLESIVSNYLSLKYNISIDNNKKDYEINYEDQYLKNSDKTLKIDSKPKIAARIPGEINKNINNTNHYIINIKELKEVCKKYNVTITEYLTGIYIYSIYLSIYKKKLDKEIIIEIPINLRRYYNVDTLSNFFVCMSVNPKILEKNFTTFNQILNQVHQEFKEKTTLDKVKSYLTRDVKIGKNIFINLIPLFIKKFFINLLSIIMSKSTTSFISNVGMINIEDKYKKYIDNVYVLVMPGKIHKIKCTICSFNNNLNVTINSNIDDIELQKTFFKLIKKEINNIKVESNNK